MPFRCCIRCPTPVACQERAADGYNIDCRTVKAQAKLEHEESPPTLAYAAAVVVRHWEQFGARGFDAAVKMLRHALEREAPREL